MTYIDFYKWTNIKFLIKYIKKKIELHWLNHNAIMDQHTKQYTNTSKQWCFIGTLIKQCHIL